jgi:hypothetical protein
VRAFDSLDPQVHPNGPPDYLDPNVELVVGDVRDEAALGKAIGEELRTLSGKPPASLREMRAERFLRIGS